MFHNPRLFHTFSVVLGITISPMPVLFSPHAAAGDVRPGTVPLLLKEFIVRNVSRIGASRQLIFATNRDASSPLVTVHLLEKDWGPWMLVSQAFRATIGEKGFAFTDEKREGDGKSPTGIFSLGTTFGYAPSISTKMAYRQATDDDFWVDDPDSEDYNKWVRGRPMAASYEKMKRDDDLYKYGVVIEYNMNPVVKGKGSAIFLHVWRGEGKPTLGCVAVSGDKILRILGWLDPARRPLIVMGTESELRSLGSH